MSRQSKAKYQSVSVSDTVIKKINNIPEWDDEENNSGVKPYKENSELEVKSKVKENNKIKPESKNEAVLTENATELEDSDEVQISLSEKDIKIIGSVFALVVFIISMIYEMSHPDSLVSVVIMFISLLAFIILVMFERE
ncbi:MAG: hypothetical protein IJZ25_04180 [Lachnospiraceae bacterium]|nr:hypothetical protein [Lachnospiraceae bacterium]